MIGGNNMDFITTTPTDSNDVIIGTDINGNQLATTRNNMLTDNGTSMYSFVMDQYLKSNGDNDFMAKALMEHPDPHDKFWSNVYNIILEHVKQNSDEISSFIPLDIMSSVENKAFWDDINKSKPSDVLYFNRADDLRIRGFWNPTPTVLDHVPSDIFFANTVPLLDCKITLNSVDGHSFTYRVVIFDNYHQRILISGDKPTCIGCIVFSGTESAWAIPLMVCEGDSEIRCGDKIAYKHIKLMDVQSYKERVANNQIGFMTMGCLDTWYGIQIALLHPLLKTIFATKTSEPVYKTIERKHKKPVRRIVRYMKRHVITVEAIDDALYNTKTEHTFTRKALVWYVIGHWRTYQNGKRIFIQPYWKGVLRHLKMDADGRDREIVMDQSMEVIP
jgi:hypothetical protein